MNGDHVIISFWQHKFVQSFVLQLAGLCFGGTGPVDNAAAMLRPGNTNEFFIRTKGHQPVQLLKGLHHPIGEGFGSNAEQVDVFCKLVGLHKYAVE
jgi:hypothetical protein